MADSITIARPYAKAVFEHARDARTLQAWSVYLHGLAAVVLDKEAAKFLTSPAVTNDQRCELLMIGVEAIKAEAASLSPQELLPAVKSFVDLLVNNSRFLMLPQILFLYEGLRSEEEKTLTVQVSAFSELTEIEEQKLIESLGKRLNRQVTLQVSIDKDLLGGAVIRAQDLVIDGSIRGKINKLRAALAA